MIEVSVEADAIVVEVSEEPTDIEISEGPTVLTMDEEIATIVIQAPPPGALVTT